MKSFATGCSVVGTIFAPFKKFGSKSLFVSGITVPMALLACSEKQSINQQNYETKPPSTDDVVAAGDDEDSSRNDPKGNRDKKDTPSATSTKSSGETSFDICKDGLKANPALKAFALQVRILCDDGKLESVTSNANIYTGGERKLFELGKNIGDMETTFKIYSGGSYDSNPEDYWNLLRLQFVKPKVFKENYLADPNAKMDLVVPTGDEVSYRYSNNSGEGGAIEYDAKTIFVTLKPGKAWVAMTQKVGPTRETMESLQSLQVVFDSNIPGKTILVSISDQIYKHASGQGQSYYDRAMNNLTTEQKNGFTNAMTSSKAKGLLGL